jgi:hypothetical protein
MKPNLDKASWGTGPWQDEPDRLEWKHVGLNCLIVRQHLGVLCGYVGVPTEHPAYGQDYGDVDVSVHGGLTYSEICQGPICHVPQSGETEQIWWLGFDCAHAWDLVPSLAKQSPVLASIGTYRTIEFVTEQVNRLAEQLAAMTSNLPSNSEQST